MFKIYQSNILALHEVRTVSRTSSGLLAVLTVSKRAASGLELFLDATEVKFWQAAYDAEVAGKECDCKYSNYLMIESQQF